MEKTENPNKKDMTGDVTIETKIINEIFFSIFHTSLNIMYIYL